MRARTAAIFPLWLRYAHLRSSVYDAFFPHTAINSARVTLSLLASEAGKFSLKLPISLALRTPSLSRSAALNCSQHCFSSMGVAFWAGRGNETVATTRNRGTILDIGTPWSSALLPAPSKQTDQAIVRSLAPPMRGKAISWGLPRPAELPDR